MMISKRDRFYDLEIPKNKLECSLEHALLFRVNTVEHMKVNKKLASKMVGIGRTTFYRHIEEKGISIDSDGRIDVSELIRVYGNENVQTAEQLNMPKKKTVEHNGTQPNPALEVEIARLKTDLENLAQERRREREQLNDQIEHLKTSLDKSMSQNEGLTRLLTDQRSQAEKLSEQKKSKEEEKLDTLLQTVQKLQEDQTAKKTWWPFGNKKTA